MRAVAAVGIALLLVGCSGGNVVESGTPDISQPSTAAGSQRAATASLSAGPRTTPTNAPSAAPALTPDSVAQVVTTNLVLRSAPGTTPDSEIYGTLDEPTLLYVLGGPESASGYAWYQVFAYGGPVRFTPIASGGPWTSLGWVAAAAKDGEPWIASVSLNCVEEPQIEDLFELGVGALACYGDRELTFPAMYRSGDALIPCNAVPGWLFCSGYRLTALPCAFECPVPTPTPHVEPYLYVHAAPDNVHADPDTGYLRLFGSADNTPVEVVGHFDDPDAQSCISGELPGGYVPPPEETVLRCRAGFVVTEVTEITR